MAARWEEICRRHGLRYLLLFGSRVSGRPDALSDWDFAAKWGRRPSAVEVLELLADLEEAVGSDRVDLVVLDEAGPPPALLAEALWGGRVLCVVDRAELLWDRVRAAALYAEYCLLFRPLAVRGVRRLAERGARAEG